MRLFIVLIFVTVFISCKKSQQIGPTSFPKVFESKSFLTLDFDLDDSILRRKLLNEFVMEQLGDEQSFKEEIKNGDEFEFIKLKLDINTRDLKLYNEREKTHAKLIISYPDKEEVYFLPPSILLSEALVSLKLNSNREQSFYLKGQSKYTAAGQAIYGVYFSREDLVVNDQHFYQVELTADMQLINRSIKIEEGQFVSLFLSYQYFLEGISNQVFSGRARPCTRDLMEAGLCGCDYHKNVSNQKLEIKNAESLEDLGLSFLIDEKLFLLSDLGVFKKDLNNNEIRVDLDLSLHSNSRQINFMFSQNKQLMKIFISPPTDYKGNCYRNETTSSEILRAEVKIVGKMIIKGRGHKLIEKLKF